MESSRFISHVHLVKTHKTLEKGRPLKKKAKKKKAANQFSSLLFKCIGTSVRLVFGVESRDAQLCLPKLLPGVEQKVFSAALCSSFMGEMSCSSEPDHSAAETLRSLLFTCSQ